MTETEIKINQNDFNYFIYTEGIIHLSKSRWQNNRVKGFMWDQEKSNRRFFRENSSWNNKYVK